MKFPLFLLLCLIPVSSFAQNLAVWDFSTRDGKRNEITVSLTEEFEEALVQNAASYTLFERRKLDRLQAVVENEKAISGISVAGSEKLKLLGISLIAFGQVFDDSESGDVSVTVRIEGFDGKQLRAESVSMGRALLKDRNSRREKMVELAKKISDVTATSDPGALRKRMTQYSVVFDEKERVLADFGAMSMLEGIAVTASLADQPLRIVVRSRDFLVAEPILTSLDSNSQIIGERGPGFTWIFKVYWVNCIVADSPPIEARPQRFRLEILK